MKKSLLSMSWFIPVLTGGFLLVCSGSLQGAAIPTGKDVAGIRTSLGINEGYLSYHFVYEPKGEERTGWTDIRHPAYVATSTTNLIV